MDEKTLAQPASGGQEAISLSGPPPETFKFLNFIFEGVPEGRFIEFFYFKSGKKPAPAGPPDFLPLPLDHDRVAAQVLQRSGKQGISIGVAPRFTKPDKKYGAGKNSDIIEVTSIWGDIDYKNVNGGAIEVERRIGSLPLKPSIVVNSGYGRHVYYVFNRVLLGKDLLVWEELIKALRDTLQGDATVDLCRRMRLPGTLNIKEQTPQLCHVCEDDSSWLRYGLEEVREAFNGAARQRETAERTPVRQTAGALPSRLQEIWTQDELKRRGIRKQVVEAIVTGKWTVRTGSNAGRSDDQSSRDNMVANSLLERKFTPDEIADIFRAYPAGCGSKVADPRHGEVYLDRTIKAAVQHQREKGLNGNGNGKVKESEDAGSTDGSLSESLNETILPPFYEFQDDGSIWYRRPPTEWDKSVPKPEYICNSLMRIVEIHENLDTGQLSAVIEYRYGDLVRKATILRSQMVDARNLVAGLGGAGAPVTSNNARKIVSYLSSYESHFIDTIPKKKVTSRFGRGRSDGPFFLPGMTSDVEFAPTGAGDMSLFRAFSSRNGSLQGWRETVNLVSGDTMMIPQAAICAAFVPPLQSKLQIPNFILDINGTTGCGKSITAKLAASVWGKPKDPDSIIMQWEVTKVAAEQVAGMCSELPLFLDDAQHVSDDLKKTVIYMIANGRGKARGSKVGGIRDTPYWHTVCISTSEHPLHEASPHEGARARLLPVGGVEVRPFPKGMKSFVDGIERAIVDNHGYAGEMFIRHISAWTDNQWLVWRQRYSSIRRALSDKAKSDIVGRVSDYIAAIQIAGEIARQLFGLNFDTDAVSSWLMSHLEDQQKEQNHVALALQALGDFYVSQKKFFYGSEPYATFEGQNQLLGAVKRGEYVGFLHSTINDVFAKRKWNTTAILNKFAAEKILHAPDAGRHTKKVGVAGDKPRMVCVNWKALFPDNAEGEGDVDIISASTASSSVM
jgi:putative DNA primase/helicase